MIVSMFFAELICSDEACAERFEAIGTVEELEALACDCGCALVVLSIAESDVGGELELVPLSPRGDSAAVALAPLPLRDAA
jgi:hypothetical protein